MKLKLLSLLTLILAAHYAQGQKANNAAELRSAITKAEASFCADLKAKGAAWAFHTYAAPDAVIKRDNDSLIKGPDAIRNYYSSEPYKQAVADWKPDFVDVSADGTLAYTYGKYTWTLKDKAGKEVKFSGVFHTVWKKQPDGSWKYVWD